MKKNYFFLFSLFILGISNAQTFPTAKQLHTGMSDFISDQKKIIVKQGKNPQAQSDVTLSSHFTGTAVHYIWDPGGVFSGYVTGHNIYSDDAFIQKFDNNYGVASIGVIKSVDVMFGLKQGVSTSSVTIAIWDDNSGKPGNILDQKTITFADINLVGNNLTHVTFDTPVNIPANKIFYAGVIVYYPVSSTINDVTCVMTTTNGDFPNSTTYTFTRWGDGTFETVGASVPGGVGLKAALGVFPTVDFTLGMDELSEDGLMLGQNYPNPVHGSTAINYGITNKENVVISVYDVIGNKVMEIREGDKQAGQHTINMDVSALSAGIYYYTLRAGDNSLTKKMIVLE